MQIVKNTTILYEPTLDLINQGLGDYLKTQKKSPANLSTYRTLCGERGIRTPGTSQYADFQDRCIRPLCHLSMGCEISGCVNEKTLASVSIRKRRERDSNPRYLSVRRFSRPVHSTTLPSLQ